jgi:hypothetical protein
MASEKHHHDPEPSPLGYLWMKEEFDRINVKLDRILSNTPSLCTPELEYQVLRAQKLSLSIDRKVPDRNVPPKP